MEKNTRFTTSLKSLFKIIQMEQLNSITETLNKVYKLSTNIIQRILPYMEEISEPDNDFIMNIKMSIPDISDSKAQEVLQRAAIQLSRDAKAVKREIGEFSSAILRLGRSLKDSNCPYMKEVWYGDMYGEEGLDGLVQLKNDLQIQYNNLSEDTILERAIELYTTDD